MAEPKQKPPFAPKVLFVDDEPANLRLLERALEGQPYECVSASGGPPALEALSRGDVDLVISDLDMPGMSGVELVEHIRRSGWDVDVIIVTGHATLDAAVRCMRLKTLDFILKPFDVTFLQERVREVLQKRLMRSEHRVMRGRGPTPPTLVGSSRSMADLRDLVRRAAASDEIVLVTGESGTGKEMVARAIHAGSSRAGEPYVAVDCTTLAANVVESELFGHLKGAFTGADAPKEGLFRAAGRGTVFLDEISELPPELQPKLLRALQEREVRPVGGSRSERFEARVVAASNRDLEKMVREGRFREDLYWRLNVVTVRVPPLRERRQDVLELARHFVRRYDTSPEAPRDIAPEAAAALEAYAWPGNVRELENTVRRLLVLHPDALALPDPRLPGEAPVAPGSLEDYERGAVRSALAAARGNVTQAARSLGIAKSTLYRKMKAFGLEETSGSI